MSTCSAPEVDLLRAILPLLIEVAQFYVEKRKVVTRLQSRSRNPATKSFHTSIYADLKLLYIVLPKTLDLKPEALERARIAFAAFLSVLDEDFVEPSDGASVASSDPAQSGYLELRGLLNHLESHGESLTGEARLQWLTRQIHLRKPRSDAKQSITECVRRCREAIVTKDLVGAEECYERFRYEAWSGANILCANLKTMHDKLLQDWRCECKPSHADAKFSMLWSGRAGRVVYPSSKGWISVTLELGDHHPRHTPGRREPTFCDNLEHLSIKQSMPGICAAAARLDLAEENVVLSHPGECGPPMSLDTVLEERTLNTVELRERLIFALLLAYLYLHLSGGPWWPHFRLQGKGVQSNIWFLRNALGRDTNVPLLTAPASVHATSVYVPYVYRALNEYMPSLPLFGKTLFELILGRRVILDRIEEELASYRAKTHGEIIVEVIRACLGFENMTFRTGERLDESERLRTAFNSKVIKRLQHLLVAAYKLNIGDCLRRAMENPWQMRLRPPLLTHKSAIESCVDFCLHDDGEEELINKRDMQAATKWLADLQNCSKCCLTPDEPSNDWQPVKIAVLDTGALLFDHKMKLLYNDRLKECRSWLGRDCAAAGVELVTGGDENGHGTHMTSLLLDSIPIAALNIYVAQVFGGKYKCQGQTTLQSENTAIAHAVRYAVDEWKVDIISMSFGYKETVPLVNEALRYAHYKGVLLVAAASNCGGNAPVSWPACHEHVISIFATDGFGNPYARNPSPKAYADRFAVLGTSVKGWWILNADNHPQRRYLSGTSCATPIAASIAGALLTLMRQERREFLGSNVHREVGSYEQRAERYDQCLKALKTPKGMRKLFREMSEDRGGYDIVVPWNLLGKEDNRYTVRTILSLMKDC